MNKVSEAKPVIEIQRGVVQRVAADVVMMGEGGLSDGPKPEEQRLRTSSGGERFNNWSNWKNQVDY